MKKIALLLATLIPLIAVSQSNSQKIKGSKVIDLKTSEVEAFTSIEIENAFEVELVLKSTHSIIIDADDNLHEHIDVNVLNGKLRISTDKNFVRYKRLLIEIGVDKNLTNIIAKGKSKISTKDKLFAEKLNIETYGSASVKVKYQSENISFFAKEKSKIDAVGEAKIVSVNVNDSAEIEIESVCENLSASQNLKSEFTLEGKASSAIFQITDTSFLNAAEFETGTVNLSISGASDAYVNTTDKFVLEAIGKTNTHLLGNPLINVKTFKDEATLQKTNKAPSAFKTLLK